MSAPNRWRGGDRQMKISCSVGSVEWLGDRREQDDRGRDGGVKERKRAKERKW